VNGTERLICGEHRSENVLRCIKLHLKRLERLRADQFWKRNSSGGGRGCEASIGEFFFPHSLFHLYKFFFFFHTPTHHHSLHTYFPPSHHHQTTFPHPVKARTCIHTYIHTNHTPKPPPHLHLTTPHSPKIAPQPPQETHARATSHAQNYTKNTPPAANIHTPHTPWRYPARRSAHRSPWYS